MPLSVIGERICCPTKSTVSFSRRTKTKQNRISRLSVRFAVSSYVRVAPQVQHCRTAAGSHNSRSNNGCRSRTTTANETHLYLFILLGAFVDVVPTACLWSLPLSLSSYLTVVRACRLPKDLLSPF